MRQLLAIKEVYLSTIDPAIIFSLIILFGFGLVLLTYNLVGRSKNSDSILAIVIGMPLTVFIAIVAYLNLESKAMYEAEAALELDKSIVKEEYFTPEKLSKIDRATAFVLTECLSKEYAAIHAEEGVKPCSDKNNSIVFANLNIDKLMLAKSKDIAGDEYSVAKNRLIEGVYSFKSALELYASKLASIDNLDEHGKLKDRLNSSFSSFVPYADKLVVDSLVAEVESLKLNSMQDLKKFNKILKQTDSGCFTLNKEDCKKVKQALIESKNKYTNFDYMKELKSIEIKGSI